MTHFRWLKGHGTENDFLLLPDHDGTVHGDLAPGLVAALCHRRRGIGADGVLRVVRSAALDVHPDLHAHGSAEWFMDYRNADGSVSEMCGNGVRVFALHLAQEGLVDRSEPLPIGTRDGVKTVSFAADGSISVDMGVPEVLGETKVGVADRTWAAHHVETGNPHAVAFVDDLADANALTAPPSYDAGVYPDGVNIEFVVRRGAAHVAMRVYERGSGETRSCGTGACAVAVAAAVSDGADRHECYRVDLPGGTLHVTWAQDGHLHMRGPAEIVADGEMRWRGEESSAYRER